MFSTLRHYPSTKYRLKIHNITEGLGQDRRIAPEISQASGGDRYKYFRRPIMPYMPSFGGQIVYAKRTMPIVKTPERPITPFSKTVSVQTLYR